MLADYFSLTPAALIEVVFAFVSAYGALLIWNLPRYRALAHYLIYQAALMALNLYEAAGSGLLITPVFTLLKGPLLYLFIRALVNERPLDGVKLYGQFVPPFILILLGADAGVAILLGSASQIAYLGLSFRLLRRYHRAACEFRSDAQSLKLNWLSIAYWIIAAQAVSGVLRLNLQRVVDRNLLEAWFTLDLLFLFGVCCFLLFKALRQPLLYDRLLAYEDVREKPSSSERQGEAREATSVFARLKTLIVEGELYRKPRLSVEDLATETGLQMKDISWAFNLGGGASFNEYINRLRVDAFKRMVEVSVAGQKSLLEMAFECGFNSKSSFNATFKHEVGMTPSQYMKNRIPKGSVCTAERTNLPVSAELS